MKTILLGLLLSISTISLYAPNTVVYVPYCKCYKELSPTGDTLRTIYTIQKRTYSFEEAQRIAANKRAKLDTSLKDSTIHK